MLLPVDMAETHQQTKITNLKYCYKNWLLVLHSVFKVMLVTYLLLQGHGASSTLRCHHVSHAIARTAGGRGPTPADATGWGATL
jgi:hypothetical protein